MTLILAIGCSDGAIMASDSASTEGDGTKQTTVKIKIIQDMLLYGGSGNLSTIQKIINSLSNSHPPLNPGTTLGGLRKEIRRRHGIELVEARDSYVQWGSSPPPMLQPPIAHSLFVGVNKSKPYLLELDPSNTDTIYDESMGNFAAIGSGSPFARALFRQFLNTPCSRTLDFAKVLAYRVIDESIKIAASGLAEPIHMFTIDLQSQIKEVDESEKEVIRSTISTWKQLEEETIGKLLAPTEPEHSGGVTEIPSDD